jgi:hypothetical protein
MLQEREHWVGIYASRYAHFDNRSTSRVEGAHVAIKTALEKISSDKISTVTAKIDHWYSAMVCITTTQKVYKND